MSMVLTPVVTDVGITTLIDARNRGVQAKIVKIAVGDGGGEGYIPTSAATELKNEIQRVEISGGELIGAKQNQLHLTGTIRDDGDHVPGSYSVYEIGFFLESGELFAIYASSENKITEKVRGTDFLLSLDITFSGVEAGHIVVDGSGKLDQPLANDNLLLGPNTIKIHTQAEFDKVFNQGDDTIIRANTTIALSPIQGVYPATGFWNWSFYISAFTRSVLEPETKITCTLELEGDTNIVREGDRVVIVGNRDYNGTYIATNITPNTFDISNANYVPGTAECTVIREFYRINSFSDSLVNPGLKTTIQSGDEIYGMSEGDRIIVTGDNDYNGVHVVSNMADYSDNFDIDSEFIGGDLTGGAWGGKGDNPENTFNGRPAYILKNSVKLESNVSIIGFNEFDTIIVKNDKDIKFRLLGGYERLTGVKLSGWSFDGRGGINELGGGLTAESDGGAFLLAYCEHCIINCRIVNHKTESNGGAIAGNDFVSHICAENIYENSASNGGGVYRCQKSTFDIYNCLATGDGSGADSCKNSFIRLHECHASNCEESIVLQDGRNIGIGVSTPENELDISAGIRLRGEGDIKDAEGRTRIKLADRGNLTFFDGEDNPTMHINASGDTHIAEDKAVFFGNKVRQMLNLYDSRYGIGVQDGTQYFRTEENFAWYKKGVHKKGKFDSGGGVVQMVIKDATVGIGTARPRSRYEILKIADLPVKLHVKDSVYVDGYIIAKGLLKHGNNQASYAAFTGSHEVIWSGQDKPEPGMIVSVSGDVRTRRYKNDDVSLSSTLPTVVLSDRQKDTRVVGVFIDTAESIDTLENQNMPEGLEDKDLNHWYELQNNEQRATVNSLGEGRVWVTNYNGDIAAGDFVTSSELPGYGMKQDDNLVYSYTVGKATETLDWSSITDTIEYKGKNYKKYLIAVVYTCG